MTSVLVRLLGELLLAPALHRFRAVLGVQKVVPPAEAARIVSNKLLMVNIVVVGTSPERKEVVKAPWKLVAAVGVDGLEQAENDPQIHGQNVQISGDGTPEDGAANCAQTETHDLNGRSIFSGQTEGGRILVVNFMDSLVQRSPVKSSVREIVPGIFYNEEDGDLVGHGKQGWERNGRGESEILGHGVKEPIVRQVRRYSTCQDIAISTALTRFAVVPR